LQRRGSPALQERSIQLLGASIVLWIRHLLLDVVELGVFEKTMSVERDHPDYYSILGVAPDASSADIKAAFKRLALRYHPDVYHEADAEERMRQLLIAYQTLNDPTERQAYDAQRVGKTVAEDALPRRAASATKENYATSTVSPGARRDRNRSYAFPTISVGLPARFKLGDTIFDLSAEQASTLMQQGCLWGTAQEATEAVSPEVRAFTPHTCHRCLYRWIPAHVNAEHPRLFELICPACKRNDWAEFLLMRCIHCAAVFESEQLRDPLGGGRLFFPYELFPLCPYCKTARWCPAEDARVEALRQGATQRKRRFGTRW
jgi:hypothetical protein